jgi:heat-inducible transcriptional repressor
VLTERQELVLKYIVDEFVRTAEPVGSRTLSKLLGFSSATIRNEMADLEELNYIEKTHTSSGRVPSDIGYHYYIEHLIDPDDDIKYDEIDSLFNRSEDIKDDLIEQAMSLLSQMTNYTTIALGPKGYGERIKKVELVHLFDRQALLIVITHHGHVENKQLEIPESSSVEDMKRIIEILNDLLRDTPLNQVSEKIHYELSKEKIKKMIHYNQTIIDLFIDAFTKFTQSEFYLSGQSNMLYQPEFSNLDKVRELLRFFEQNDVLKLVENNGKNELTVRIGDDNSMMAMKDCTVITVPYDIDDAKKGTIAVVGPRRMEYAKVIPLIKYIAKHMSSYLRRKDE